MLKVFFIFLSLSLGFNAFANHTLSLQIFSNIHQSILDEGEVQKNLYWKVGDENNYNIDMGFVKGTMKMLVREEIEQGYWLNQDVDLGFLGKQKIEALIDSTDGSVLKLIVNGKEQTPPEPGDFEIIDTKEDRITVPAGTFDAIHVTLRNKKDNSQSETWINPSEIPISGMLKSVSPSQMGEIKMELTSFVKK